MNNKVRLISLLIIPILSNCTVIGAKLGETVDDSTLGDAEDSHKYESQYMTEGLKADIEIIKIILEKPTEETEYIVINPCKNEHAVQVCSVNKGCWCEKPYEERPYGQI